MGAALQPVTIQPIQYEAYTSSEPSTHQNLLFLQHVEAWLHCQIIVCTVVTATCISFACMYEVVDSHIDSIACLPTYTQSTTQLTRSPTQISHCFLAHPRSHLPAHTPNALTQSLTHALTQSLTHSLFAHSPTHPTTHCTVAACTCACSGSGRRSASGNPAASPGAVRAAHQTAAALASR